MKKNSMRLLMRAVLFTSLIILPGLSQAQGPPDTDPGDPDAPIDGGIGLLVAAGIGYGIKKVRDNRKEKTTHLL